MAEAGESNRLEEARAHLEAGRPLEAMNIMMEIWNAAPGDPELLLDLARVARNMTSLRHRQILCRDLGDGDPRFGRAIAEKFLILQRISETLGATIYRARDEEAGREATLWLLDPLWRNSELDQDWVLRRLEGLRAFRHPSVARLVEFGAPADDLVYGAFEPAEGSLLSDCIATAGPLPFARAVEVVRAILEAIGAAHGEGHAHGNLRPDHVVLREGGVRILDLGLYSLVRELQQARKVTRTGQVQGALAYLPPEFERRGLPDAPWDVCTAGALAFEIFTGSPPYGHPEPRQVRSFVLKMQEPPLRASQTEGGEGLPDWVDEVIGKMLAREPEDRYQTIPEALAAWSKNI